MVLGACRGQGILLCVIGIGFISWMNLKQCRDFFVAKAWVLVMGADVRRADAFHSGRLEMSI